MAFAQLGTTCQAGALSGTKSVGADVVSVTVTVSTNSAN